MFQGLFVGLSSAGGWQEPGVLADQCELGNGRGKDGQGMADQVDELGQAFTIKIVFMCQPVAQAPEFQPGCGVRKDVCCAATQVMTSWKLRRFSASMLCA